MRGRRAFARCAGAMVIVVAGVATNVAAAHGQVVGIAPVAAGPSASAWQCANGPLTSPQPCVGSNIDSITTAIPGINGGAPTSYKNWQGGNANNNSAHWREGDFVSYRTSITGIPTGVVHTLVLSFETVSSSAHAIDYLGSYDATETTSISTTSSQGTIINANNNNPCADLVAAGQFPWACTPASPQGAGQFPPVAFTGSGGETGCGGSSGTFTGTQTPGTMDLFGPVGSAITDVSYLSQNGASGGGTCITTVHVSFTVPQSIGPGQDIVLAWGGHIASQADWGLGNGAASINGSPYHMGLVSLDGTSTGSQDLALSASAIYYTPTLATLVMVNGSALTGAIPIGSTVNDTATLSGASPTAAGTVTYSLFTNSTCSEPASTMQAVTVTNAVVPPSSTFTPTAGSYSYRADYSGGGVNLPAHSACEPFVVGKGVASLSTTVFDASTNAAIGSPVPLGATVYDTATLTSSTPGFTPTGTVTYAFFSEGDCTTGTEVGTPEAVTIGADGSVPHSANHGPLTVLAGPYAFQATYSGDANFVAGTSECEPFAVGQGVASLATTVFDASTNAAIASPVPFGATVFDTATLTSATPGITPTGTVTYTFFTGGDCTTGAAVGTPETVTIGADGSVPHSANHGPLTTAGPFAFQAAYSGDANFVSGVATCEPFGVGKGVANLATTVFDASTDTPIASPVPLGATVFDTATLTSATRGVTPTGTVTYSFFSGGDCRIRIAVPTETVTIAADGTVPASAEHGPLTALGAPYAFQAQYSGDDNFVGGVTTCEPFVVGKGVADLSTTVFDASTNAAIANPVPLGATVFDTASLTSATPGITPTGTVTYTFFAGSACTPGTEVGVPETVTVGAGGTVPNSSDHGPLTVTGGPYAFRAEFSGDANFVGGISGCEPIAVGMDVSHLSTTVFDASTGAPIASRVQLGGTVFDTATLTSELPGVTPTGTVTYTFFAGGDCATGTEVGSAETVTVGTGGSVPNSANHGPLSAADGPYAFQAQYSGDANFVGGTSECEPFTLDRGAAELQTTVFDASTGAAIASPVRLGATVFDTTTLTSQTTGFTPTGTVTYTFFSRGDCSGTPVFTQTVTIGSDGSVPNSANQGPLTAAGGPYAFQAQYSGDGNFVAGSSDCEPFTVAKGAADQSTTVFDASTGSAIVSPVPLGATVFDTATLTPETPGITPTGTVTYSFFSGSDCRTRAVVPTETVTIAPDGTVTPSADHGPLTAAGAPYAFQARYSGDANFVAGTSDCEPFDVGRGAADLSTTVFDASTNAAIASPAPLGATAFDTATLTSQTERITPTGTVTYTFFSGGDCTTGSLVSAQTVTLGAGGSVPHSANHGPLTAAGQHYAFKADYSGDENFMAGGSDCEPFDVGRGAADPSTTVFDASTNAPVTHVLPLGATVFDTTKLTSRGGFAPAGTVTYTFFHSGECTAGNTAGTETVTIGAGGLAPQSSDHGPLGNGDDAFEVRYSGDPNFLAGTSACEPLSVDKAGLGFASTIFDASTNQPVSGTLSTGASVFDTAKLTTTSGIAPTGTVTYSFFSGGDCVTGHLVATEAVTVGPGGVVPPSNIPGPLTTGGPFAFRDQYSGDVNFLGSGSPCEPASSGASPSATAELPFTGLPATLVVVAAAALGIGAALTRASRRKRVKGRRLGSRSAR